MKFTMVLLLTLGVLCSLLPAQEETTMEESLLKSGYIYNICKYSRWSRPENADKPIVISIIGKTTPGNELRIPEDKTIRNRKVIIRKIEDLAEIDDCHVLFITGTEADRLNDILVFIANRDILSVGDTPGFARKGVIINLYVEKDSVSFEINREAAKSSTVNLSSQLYSVAGRIVETKNDG